MRVERPSPLQWARGIVQGEAGMSTRRASGEWRHRKVAERRSLWAALVSAAKAKPQRRTVHTLVVWAAKMSIAGGGGQGMKSGWGALLFFFVVLKLIGLVVLCYLII